MFAVTNKSLIFDLEKASLRQSLMFNYEGEKQNETKQRKDKDAKPGITKGLGQTKDPKRSFLVENDKKMEKYFVFGKFVCYFAP